MVRVLLAATLGLLTLAPSLASASILDRPHTHEGFFLRLQLGPSSLDISSKEAPVSFGGAGGVFSVAFGGAIVDNLVLYGELVSDTALDPKITVGSQSFGTRDLSVGVLGFGPGIAYYFMPINVYVSGTLLAARAIIQTPDGSANSDFGLGARLGVGKEWWVSKSWGLGIAGTATFASMDDLDDKLSSTAYALLFTATFN